MKNVKRLFALGMATALAVGTLTGCGNNNTNNAGHRSGQQRK